MKKIACSIAVLALATTAFADILLWQVPTSPVSGSDPGGYTGGTGNIAWEYALLNYTTSSSLDFGNVGTVDSSVTTPAIYHGNDELDAADNSLAGKKVGSEYGDGSSYTSGYWYIGLYNADGDIVGFSQLMANDDVQNFRATSRNIADWNGVNAMGAGMTYTAAPEPTSGVLLLLGAAVLGLRRRKVA